MTNQEIFDRCLTHLRAQGRRSAAPYMCQYRGPNGLKCAIGALIPDEKYHLRLEGSRANSPAVRDAAGLAHEQADFATVLQRQLHDKLGDNLEGLEDAALRFAVNYNLEYTPC